MNACFGWRILASNLQQIDPGPNLHGISFISSSRGLAALQFLHYLIGVAWHIAKLSFEMIGFCWAFKMI